VDVPAGLGERGTSIWVSLATDDPARNALVLESARIADRLDELDSIIQGKGVLNLMQFRVLDKEVDDADMNIVVEVKFQSVLAEAKSQAVALAGILGKFSDSSKSSTQPAEASQENVTPLERLRQKRANRGG